MDPDDYRRLFTAFPGTRLMEANGDLFAVHDPDRDLPPQRQQPWATLVTSDDSYDSSSRLDRPGLSRLNIGLTRARFAELIDPAAEHDPTAVDVLFPHPVYGGLHWVCVINPDLTWPTARGLLDEAHAFAVRKHRNAQRRRSAQD